MDKLSDADRATFAALDLGAATLPPDQFGPALTEPRRNGSSAMGRQTEGHQNRSQHQGAAMKRRFIVPCAILALVGLPVLAGLPA
ncbi:hypothetical protein [Pararhizobium sp. LjRoot235]|uniref:hypothetical protein n=1 Tax=Pararhizobium sp. LjRoot235 TaxID=3342291 RepID=UPI003F508FBD